MKLMNLEKDFNKDLKVFLIKIFQDQLDKAIKYSLTIGGKRIRPFIVKKISDLLKLSSKELLQIALASVEFLHTYSHCT